MISQLLYALERGSGYVKAHPQLLFVLLLVIVLPVAFLYSSNKFLEVGQANQDRLQKDKIGLLHDAMVSVLYATEFDTEKIQTEIDRITKLNPDLTKFRVAKTTPGSSEIIILAAAEHEHIATTESEPELYRTALTRPDESIIVPFSVDGHRLWQSFRAILTDSGTTYYIFTETDLFSIDQLFASRKLSAYATLVVLYLFLMALAIWLVRLTDYRFLYAEAKKANQTKDLFTNMIAHELRAPLTAMRGYASIAKDEATSENEQKYAERILLSSERLLNIVNDLLDVARIQSGKLSVENAPFALAPEVAAVLDELKVSAAEKNIELKQTADLTEHTVLADQKRFHQALTNLISNAIKYTKAGTITVAIKDYPDGVELRVEDTGMGIAAEDQQKLFAPFFRVETEDVSQITGTGLGMWITRQMVELMGGTIAVESIKGIGTHVVVKLKKPEK